MLKVVAAGLKLPPDHHDFFILELPWSRVEHGSLGPLWAHQEISILYDLSVQDHDEGS